MRGGEYKNNEMEQKYANNVENWKNLFSCFWDDINNKNNDETAAACYLLMVVETDNFFAWDLRMSEGIWRENFKLRRKKK